jgi:hydrogenase expression/formation protein HypE
MYNMSFELDCPLPKVDFDFITLGHGSGGQLTNKLLDELVFELFSNPKIDTRHDGAIFQLQGNCAISTDSFVVSPVFFPGGNIGDLAINGTVNDLAMCGAVPRYLSVGLILEEGLPIAELWEILVSMKKSAERCGVQVITGDTKVVERGKADKIFINTTGIGRVHEDCRIGYNEIRPGDKIIVSGPVATHGMAVMSVREGLEFESGIESDTAPLSQLTIPLIEKYKQDIHFLRDPTRGGVASVLNEISTSSELGINIREEKIPVLENVSSACEILGIDPLYVANEGVFLAIVDRSVEDQVLKSLRDEVLGQSASVIGEITKEHPGKVVSYNAYGGSRIIRMLPGEQLPRIC